MAAWQRMYEAGALCLATGGLLRPGGLALTERLLEACELSPGDRLLDAGCGSGVSVQYLRAAHRIHAVGIDRSGALLQQGQQALTETLPLACAQATAMPFATHSLDAVLSECSFSSISCADDFLIETWRVLRPGGRLAITDVYVRNPAGVSSLRALPFTCGLRTAPEQAELVHRLRLRGFTMRLWEDHSTALKVLARQAVLAHGSLKAFWSQAEPDVDPLDIAIAISRAQLGYFLLVAQKMA